MKTFTYVLLFVALLAVHIVASLSVVLDDPPSDPPGGYEGPPETGQTTDTEAPDLTFYHSSVSNTTRLDLLLHFFTSTDWATGGDPKLQRFVRYDVIQFDLSEDDDNSTLSPLHITKRYTALFDVDGGYTKIMNGPSMMIDWMAWNVTSARCTHPKIPFQYAHQDGVAPLFNDPSCTIGSECLYQSLKEIPYEVLTKALVLEDYALLQYYDQSNFKWFTCGGNKSSRADLSDREDGEGEVIPEVIPTRIWVRQPGSKIPVGFIDQNGRYWGKLTSESVSSEVGFSSLIALPCN